MPYKLKKAAGPQIAFGSLAPREPTVRPTLISLEV